jgi:hypothetical protein
MAEKLLVCVAAEQVTAGRWRRGHLEECRVYTNDQLGFAAFEKYISQFSGVPAYLMVDAVEEDYRFETLPHAFGSDRSEMVRRKLRQHYRNLPYVNASFLGRDAERRRDDRYLFSALTNPDLIAAWLQALLARELPLAGVFMLPMVSAALVTSLRLKAPNVLLVAQHASGLRLTFLRDRQFRLSRLTRGDAGRTGSPERVIAEEISNTRIYLHALRAARLDEPLAIVLLDHGDQLGGVAEIIARDNPSLDCMHLERRALAGRLRVAEPLLAATSDAMYLALLGKQAPSANHAPSDVTGGFGRYRQRRALYAAAGTAALFALGWSGVNLWQTALTHADREAAVRQTQQLRAAYQEITRQFPATPTAAANLKRAVDIAQQLSAGVRTPDRLMHAVSRALEATPGIAIRRLTWKHGTGDIDAGASVPSGTQGVPGPSGTGGPFKRESGLIEAEIRPFRGDYRLAIEQIHSFANHLASHPEVAETRIVKLPLNIDPKLPLSGNTIDKGDSGEGADFRLAVVLKPPS